MQRYIILLLTGLLSLCFLALPDTSTQVPVTVSENKVIIEGKIYYIHIVKPGQTLYSISKAYHVTEKDIAIENPGVYSGLQIGQVLKIPAEVPQEIKKPAEIDTSEFVEHRLRRGETIYSLSRVYNVSPESIEKSNPGISINNLSIGQIILIPKLTTVISDKDFVVHKVRRKETLYSLARQYGVKEEDIKNFNPELQWGGLKTGQVIRIPTSAYLAKQEVKVDTVIFDTIAPPPLDTLLHDFVYLDSLGLEEMSLNDYSRSLKDFNRRRLNVAYLIPFNYKAAKDSLILGNRRDINGKLSEEQVKEENMMPASINFLEFFEGALLALDALRDEGIDLNVQFFDTYRSPSRVREILNSDFFRDVDLIIGPFFAYNVEIVSEFSREKGIPLISPFYDGLDLTDRNPFLFQVNPSYKTEYSKIAEVLARDFDKNFIFVYQQDSLKFHERNYLKNELIQSLQQYTHSENVVIKEISYINAAKANLSQDLSHAMSKDRTNIIVIPENDEAFVSAVITQLYFLLREYNIRVFGLPYFYQFNNIDFQYFHALGLSYLSPFYFSYYDPRVISFFNQYRTSFKTEPRLATRKGCPYAFIGYDLSYYFIKNITMWDRRFPAKMNDGNIVNLLPDFYFERNNNYGGFENKRLKLIRFTDDYAVTTEDVEIVKRPLRSSFMDFLQTGNNDE